MQVHCKGLHSPRRWSFSPLISNGFLCLNSAVTSEGTPVGHSVIKVRATDEDKGTNAEITYAIMGGDDRGKRIT